MNPEKHKKKRRKYDNEFKSEVLKMLASGQSAPHIARSLGIGENLIYRWKNQQKQTLLDNKAQQSDYLLKVIEENQQLKNQLKRAETERDILKKAIYIFSQRE